MPVIQITEQDVCNLVDSVRKQVIEDAGLKSAMKLMGDVCSRVLARLIYDHLVEIDSDLKPSDINAYILGMPIEFDLLIVDKVASPINHTNCYNPQDVRYALEFKYSGVFGGDKDGTLDKVLLKIKVAFEEAQKKCNLKEDKCIYLTIYERASTTKEGSINYYRRTKDQLDPFPVFCLYDNHKKSSMQGQWTAFLNLIN